jgi:hypothetical protein
VIHVKRPALCEQRVQHWIGENLGVEKLLEAVERLVAAGVLVQASHVLEDKQGNPASVGRRSSDPDGATGIVEHQAGPVEGQDCAEVERRR